VNPVSRFSNDWTTGCTLVAGFEQEEIEYLARQRRNQRALTRICRTGRYDLRIFLSHIFLFEICARRQRIEGEFEQCAHVARILTVCRPSVGWPDTSRKGTIVMFFGSPLMPSVISSATVPPLRLAATVPLENRREGTNADWQGHSQIGATARFPLVLDGESPTRSR